MEAQGSELKKQITEIFASHGTLEAGRDAEVKFYQELAEQLISMLPVEEYHLFPDSEIESLRNFTKQRIVPAAQEAFLAALNEDGEGAQELSKFLDILLAGRTALRTAGDPMDDTPEFQAIADAWQSLFDRHELLSEIQRGASADNTPTGSEPSMAADTTSEEVTGALDGNTSGAEAENTLPEASMDEINRAVDLGNLEGKGFARFFRFDKDWETKVAALRAIPGICIELTRYIDEDFQQSGGRLVKQAIAVSFDPENSSADTIPWSEVTTSMSDAGMTAFKDYENPPQYEFTDFIDWDGEPVTRIKRVG